MNGEEQLKTLGLALSSISLVAPSQTLFALMKVLLFVKVHQCKSATHVTSYYSSSLSTSMPCDMRRGYFEGVRLS